MMSIPYTVNPKNPRVYHARETLNTFHMLIPSTPAILCLKPQRLFLNDVHCFNKINDAKKQESKSTTQSNWRTVLAYAMEM